MKHRIWAGRHNDIPFHIFSVRFVLHCSLHILLRLLDTDDKLKWYAIIVVLVFILAFIKDLGVNKSTCLSLMVLILNVIKLFFDVAEKVTIPSGFANFVLACVLCVFVSAKYADKASRGAK